MEVNQGTGKAMASTLLVTQSKLLSGSMPTWKLSLLWSPTAHATSLSQGTIMEKSLLVTHALVT